MSTEFRPIAKAPLYEMNKEGDIRKIDKKTPAIPFPLGSDNVMLQMDAKDKNKRSSFKISELKEEVWGVKSKKEMYATDTIALDHESKVLPAEKMIRVQSERAKDTAQMPSSGKTLSTTAKQEKVAETTANAGTKQEEKPTAKPSSSKVDKIMKIKCKMSFKIWKLHEAGLSIAEIKAIVKHPHSVGVPATIERYKKKPELRERASKVK